LRKFSPNNIRFIFVLPAFLVLFFSCEESRVFDKDIAIASAGWDYDDIKTFEVNITDTVSSYNMYVNVRHTDEYPFNNIWLRITTIFPDSTKEEGRVNIQISEPGGRWTGNCADGICYNSIPIQQNFTFSELGSYTFIIQQDMRINPLPSIMNVGLKVEKFITP